MYLLGWAESGFDTIAYALPPSSAPDPVMHDEGAWFPDQTRQQQQERQKHSNTHSRLTKLDERAWLPAAAEVVQAPPTRREEEGIRLEISMALRTLKHHYRLKVYRPLYCTFIAVSLIQSNILVLPKYTIA